MRLDQFLTYKISRMTRSQGQMIIRSGNLSIVPPRQPKPSLRVQPGDIIVIRQELEGDEPQFDEVRCLFENEAFFVFDKPAGMLVHPTASVFQNTLTAYSLEQLGKEVFVVHRLDRETSGLVAMAKSSAWSSELYRLFVSHDIRKEYVAVVYDPKEKYQIGDHFEFNTPLGFIGELLPKLTMGRGQLPALTSGYCLKRQSSLALLALCPHTGRQHQLRVHLALAGTPILGDKLYFYGESFYKDYLDGLDVPDFYPSRHLLHARRLIIPWQGASVETETGIPELFEMILSEGVSPSCFPTAYSRQF